MLVNTFFKPPLTNKMKNREFSEHDSGDRWYLLPDHMLPSGKIDRSLKSVRDGDRGGIEGRPDALGDVAQTGPEIEVSTNYKVKPHVGYKPAPRLD